MSDHAAEYPHLEIEGDWLIEVVNYHTCGAGPGSGAGHEPGCGTIPVGRLATPEHDAAVKAEAERDEWKARHAALREDVSEKRWDNSVTGGDRAAHATVVLRGILDRDDERGERADRIEREGGESDA